MNKYPILTGTYNQPNPMSWFSLFFGFLLMGLGPVFYSIKPDEPAQLYMALAMGAPLAGYGVFSLLRWGVVEIYEDKLRLFGKLRKGTVEEIPFSSIVEMNVLEAKTPNDQKVTFSTGGAERKLGRVKPKNFAGFIWMAARFNDVLPVAALEGTPRKAKFKDWPAALPIAARELKDERGKKFTDDGVLVPCKGRYVYIPVTNTTKGPGAIALLVSPVTVMTTLYRKGMPRPSELPLLTVLAHVWTAHKLTLEQKEAFAEALSVNLMGNELQSLPPEGEKVSIELEGYEATLQVVGKPYNRMVFSTQGL